MEALAEWIARKLWGGLLWWMRRPFIKKFRRNSISIFPKPYQEKASRSLARQDRFARRHGITLLKWAVMLFLISLFGTVGYFCVLWLHEQGALARPKVTQ